MKPATGSWFLRNLITPHTDLEGLDKMEIVRVVQADFPSHRTSYKCIIRRESRINYLCIDAVHSRDVKPA